MALLPSQGTTNNHTCPTATAVTGEREREETMRKVIYNLSELSNIGPELLPGLFLQSLNDIYFHQENTICETLKAHDIEALQNTRKLLLHEFFKIFPSHLNKAAISRRTKGNIVSDIYLLGKSIFCRDISNEVEKLFKNGNDHTQNVAKETSQVDKEAMIDTLKKLTDELLARQKSQEEAHKLLVSQHLSLANEHLLLVRQIQNLNILNQSNGSVPLRPSQSTPPPQPSAPPLTPPQALSSVAPSAPPLTPTHTPIPSAPLNTPIEEPMSNLSFLGNIDEDCDSDKGEDQIDNNRVGDVATVNNIIEDANHEDVPNAAVGESSNQISQQGAVTKSKKKSKKKSLSTLYSQLAREDVAKLYIAGGHPDSNVEHIFEVLTHIGIARQRCTAIVHKRTKHETSFQVTVPEGLVDSVFKHAWPAKVFVRPFREHHDRRRETRKPLTRRTAPRHRYTQTWNRRSNEPVNTRNHRNSGPANTWRQQDSRPAYRWSQQDSGPANRWSQQGSGPLDPWNQRDSGPVYPWNQRNGGPSYTWNQQSSGPVDQWNQQDGGSFNTWNQYGYNRY